MDVFAVGCDWNMYISVFSLRMFILFLQCVAQSWFSNVFKGFQMFSTLFIKHQACSKRHETQKSRSKSVDVHFIEGPVCERFNIETAGCWLIIL